MRISVGTILVIIVSKTGEVQNKVIEALAMSKAVVSSPQAAEGLRVMHDVHLQLASTPEEWVEASLAMFDDNQLRQRLGIAGRNYVEDQHRWEVKLEIGRAHV